MPHPMPADTDRLILEVPILEDKAIDALHTFLLDLLSQVENHYAHQLRRIWREYDARSRDPLEPWKRITPAPPEPEEECDDELNDELPF